MNALTAAEAGIGLGVNFVCRDILDATSTDDAVARASRPGMGGAAHFNLADVSAERATRRSALSLEFAPSAAGDASAPARTSALRLDGAWYAHTNQFLRMGSEPPIGDVESSLRRLARAATLALGGKAAPAGSAGMMAVLADRHDTGYPIYRGSARDEYVTLVSVVFDLEAGTLTAFDRRPLPGTPPALVLQMTGERAGSVDAK